MRKVRARADNVIIRIHHKEKIGSIFVPTETAQKYNADFYGEVLNVGDGVKMKDEISVGDKLCFYRHEGKKIVVDGEELYVLNERHIMGKLEEE